MECEFNLCKTWLEGCYSTIAKPSTEFNLDRVESVSAASCRDEDHMVCKSDRSSEGRRELA
jgi:hypothetical protein